MAGFEEVFESVANWERNPNRDPANLPRLVDESPELGDVILAGQPALDASTADPDAGKRSSRRRRGWLSKNTETRLKM